MVDGLDGVTVRDERPTGPVTEPPGAFARGPCQCVQSLSQAVEQIVQREAIKRGDRGPDARRVQVGQPGQGKQQLDELAPPRRLPEDVQAVADLGPRQLAQVGVQVFQQVGDLPALHARERHGRALGGQTLVPFVGVVAVVLRHQPREVGVQAGSLDQVPDLALKERQLRRVEQFNLIILVHKLGELLELAIHARRRQRRNQMIDEHRMGSALGLGSLAGVVEDERVK